MMEKKKENPNPDYCVECGEITNTIIMEIERPTGNMIVRDEIRICYTCGKRKWGETVPIGRFR